MFGKSSRFPQTRQANDNTYSPDQRSTSDERINFVGKSRRGDFFDITALPPAPAPAVPAPPPAPVEEGKQGAEESKETSHSSNSLKELIAQNNELGTRLKTSQGGHTNVVRDISDLAARKDRMEKYVADFNKSLNKLDNLEFKPSR